MTTQPESDSTDYRSEWKPPYIREREQQHREMELALAAMDPAERSAMLKRIDEAAG